MRGLVVGLLVLLTTPFSPVLAQCTADPQEPDDACIPGRTILAGGLPRSLDFCDDPSDWMRFQGCGGRTYTIATSALGPSADTVLEVYDAACSVPLAFDDDGGGGTASRLTFVAPQDGVFHLRVGQKNAATGPGREYTVRIDGDTSACSTWTASSGTFKSWQVESLHDGRVLAVGEDQGEGPGSSDLEVTVLDGEGRLLSRRIFGTPLGETPNDLVLASDGGFFVTGHAYNINAPDIDASFDGLIVRFDPTGGVVWARRYGGTKFDTLYGVVETADGGAIAVGGTDSATGSARKGWMIRVAADGSLLASRTFGSDTSLRDVVATSDGGFAAVGFDGRSGMLLVRLDPTGGTVSKSAYESPWGNVGAHAVVRTDSGGLAIAGTWLDTTGTQPSLLLLTDASGLPVDGRSYSAGFEVGGAWIQAMRERPAGGFVIARSAGDAQPNPSITWTDGAGAIEQERWRAVGGGASLTLAADGGAIVSMVGEIRRFAPDPPAPACGLLGNGWMGNESATFTVAPSGVREDTLAVTSSPLTLSSIDPPSNWTSSCHSCAPPAYAGLLRVSETTNGTEIGWSAGGAAAFDVVSGDLAVLRDVGGDFTPAIDAPGEGCLADDTTANSALDGATLGEDEGRFYLLAPVAALCGNRGSFDSGSATQAGSRDAEVAAAFQACP